MGTRAARHCDSRPLPARCGAGRQLMRAERHCESGQRQARRGTGQQWAQELGGSLCACSGTATVDSGQHGVELGGIGYARGAAL